MKTLLLIRHTKSDWSDSSLSDFDRPLKDSRKADAKKMSKFLSDKNFLPEMIISSPAKRTLETAKLFCKAWKRKEKEIQQELSLYECSTTEILEVIHKTDNQFSSMVIFGHNPAFTDFANLFIKNKIENIPTTGVVCLEFETDNWEKIKRTNASLKFFIYPKMNLPFE